VRWKLGHGFYRRLCLHRSSCAIEQYKKLGLVCFFRFRSRQTTSFTQILFSQSHCPASMVTMRCYGNHSVDIFDRAASYLTVWSQNQRGRNKMHRPITRVHIYILTVTMDCVCKIHGQGGEFVLRGLCSTYSYHETIPARKRPRCGARMHTRSKGRTVADLQYRGSTEEFTRQERRPCVLCDVRAWFRGFVFLSCSLLYHIIILLPHATLSISKVVGVPYS
jgi:hypothetical protein